MKEILAWKGILWWNIIVIACILNPFIKPKCCWHNRLYLVILNREHHVAFLSLSWCWISISRVSNHANNPFRSNNFSLVLTPQNRSENASKWSKCIRDHKCLCEIAQLQCDSKGEMSPFRSYQCQSQSGCCVGPIIAVISVCAHLHSCVFAYSMWGNIAIWVYMCVQCMYVCFHIRPYMYPVLRVSAFIYMCECVRVGVCTLACAHAWV